MTSLRFDHALLPDGWAENVRIEVDPAGTIAAVEVGAGAAHGDRSIAVPGLPNLHSHAFQRGMAGLAERRGEGEDSFWTWRQVMYGFLARLTPDHVAAIAAQAYVEMVEAGFTAVAEFHYLHHRPDGGAYDAPAEMAGAIARGAAESGIGLTLLPVLYAHGGFGGQASTEGQRRFVTDLDRYARLVEDARRRIAPLPDAVLGIAPHSLRAVTADLLETALGAHRSGPVHIHVAEQRKEVEDCLAWSGRRPVDWLIDHAPVGPRWCLVHATHVTPGEVARIAAAGAVVGLCPITEANLGDGLFPVPGFLAAGGRIGVGSDSNVRIDAAEELRLLEYGQRLRDLRRNVVGPPGGSTGRAIFDACAAGGAQALGRAVGALAPGRRADIVALDPDHPAFAAARGDGWLDGWLFAGDGRCIRDVWIGGRRVVADGRHVARDAVRGRFAWTLAAVAG
ncbi:MAG: formimidoylglutamate deiminase [Alphaproteobacteria bacterium]